MSRGATTTREHGPRTRPRARRPRRRAGSWLVLLLICGGLHLPGAVQAQWLGLPDPPDPPDPDVSLEPVPAVTRPEPSAVARDAPPEQTRPVLPRHEFTASAVVSVTALIVRSAHAHDHDYRIVLSLREVYLQSSWTVFGQRALGLRLAAGVALGKPVLDFTRPFDFSIDVFGTEPQPDRVPAPVVSMDASAGFLARTGPVRFGPQLVYSSTWLRDAGGYTVDVDLPFTLSTRLHAVGVGFLVDVRPHPNVSLTVEGRAYLQSRLPGGSIRFGLGFSWSAA